MVSLSESVCDTLGSDIVSGAQTGRRGGAGPAGGSLGGKDPTGRRFVYSVGLLIQTVLSIRTV
jgi:hypothetical protein